MVPGSTFRYGSNFWQVTFSPRLSSRQPMDAAAMPLPSEETTPPVTNMYLAIPFHPRVPWRLRTTRDTLSRSSGVSTPSDSYSVSTTRIGYPFSSARNCSSRSACSSGPTGSAGIPQQKIAAVDVQPDVFEMSRAAAPASRTIGNRAARKINRVAVAVGHHLHHVGIGDLARILDALLQRAHDDRRHRAPAAEWRRRWRRDRSAARRPEC